jgi:hypothetical protein
MLGLVFCLFAGRADAQPLTAFGGQPATSPADAKAGPRRTEAGPTTPIQGPPAASTVSPSSSAPADSVKKPVADADSDRGPRQAIEEVRPEVMYLREKSGRLVPVPGFSYEDFLELLRLKQRADLPPDKVPDVSHQQLLIAGTADGQVAQLTARFDIQVRATDWVAAPLGLAGLALSGPPEYQGSGDCFINYDEGQQQYVAWLRGKPGEEHRITIGLRAPLAITGKQTRLALTLPRAATSKLELKVPGRKIIASVKPAELGADVAHGEGSSTISVLGIGGSAMLTWSEATGAKATNEPVLESAGFVLARIDGRSVTSDVTLNVRSFGAAFDRFHVRLPQGAVLAGGQQPGYTVAQAESGDSSLVEIKLDAATIGPVEVKLQSERMFDLTRPEVLELAGFQVLEAVAHRQGGQIGVAVDGDWQVMWGSRARVRQIDAAEEADKLLRQGDLLAAFEYVGQPCSLTARVVPRQPRIAVDPEYVYYLDARQTVLHARLKYSIRGAKVFSLELDLPGWQVDEIGPASVVDLSSLIPGEDARTRIPLVQPMMGDVEVTLRAHRSHASNPGDIELALPVIKDAVVGPATVAIVPDDNVELATRSESLEALSRQRAPTTLKLPARRQVPLVYRGERAGAKYVAGLTVHDQKVEVQVSTEAKVGRAGLNVEQRFSYQVLYEPVERLSFAVPTALATGDRLEIYIGQELVTPHLLSDDQNGEQSLRQQIVLTEPRIGLVEVISRYELPLNELPSVTTNSFKLPLVMPLEGEFAGNTLAVNCEPGYGAQLRGEHWKATQLDDSSGRRLQLEAATAATSAELSISVEDRAATRAAVVDRAWVQTWLADRVREERAVFRMMAAGPRISVTLPAAAVASDVEALVDGRPVRTTLNNGNNVMVDWPEGEDAHTLELRYPYAIGEAGWSVALETPAFGEGIRLHRLYWQLIVPPDQHLLTSRASLMPQFTWAFDRLHWSRSNSRDQRELEQWTQTVHEAIAPESMNVYLFSVMGDQGALEVWIARRSTIVFVASSIVLAVVLLALYAPALRRPRSLAVVGMLVCVMAMAYPGPAIVLGQAALLGVGLAAIAALLRRLLPRDSIGVEVSRPQISAAAEKSSTDVYYRPAPVSGHSSTATRALTLEEASSRSSVQ